MVSPATQLVKLPEASFRTQDTALVSAANQLAVMSPVAKKQSAEQPIGTHTLSEMTIDWPKSVCRGLNTEPRRGAEV